MADSGKDDFDVLDPEAKAKSEEKKNLIDSAQKTYDNAKKVTDSVKNLRIKALSGSKIAAIGFWGIIIILIIIIVIGIIGFFTSIPGLMIEKLKEIAQGVVDVIQSWFTTEAAAYVDEEDIIDLANYLEEMEYDLVGYGFIEPDIEYEAEYPTYVEVQEEGYIYFETKEGDSGARYYNESGNAYSGYYYNSLGILIDNSTGQIVTDASYTDMYGMERSTTDYAVSGEGIITGLGDYVDTTLLKTYLLSDYRIYSIRNNDETLTNKIYSYIKSIFGGYDEAWSKGLLKFYYASEGIATGEWSESNSIVNIISNLLNGGTVSDIIKVSGSYLYIRSGIGNNYMKFNIDGWADRYGMSLEFLLSLHIATMAPDLVNAMLQSFDTEVQVYLDTTEDAEVEFAYVDMLEDTATLSSDAITLSDVEVCLAAGVEEGVLETSGTSNITKKKAQYLLINLPLTSPDNCTGSAQEHVIEKSTYQTNSILGIDTSTNVLTTYGITEETDSEIYDDFDSYSNYETEENIEFDPEHVAQSIGTDDTDYLDKDYTYFSASASAYGYDENEAEIEEIEKTSIETTTAELVRTEWRRDY